MLELTPEEARVVGSLAEKALATPQYYPLTHNALVNACNQSNNRDPVVSYDSDTVEAALAGLRAKGMARVIHAGGGNRTTKYRHVLDEALGLDAREVALLTVLLLRGPQTLNELRTRTERLADFDDAASVDHDLRRLAGRDEPLVKVLEREPGRREPRWAATLAPTHSGRGSGSAPPTTPHGTMRVAPLGGLLPDGNLAPRERELAVLRTGWLCRSDYEWGQHVPMGRRAGLTDDEIARIPEGPGGPGWSDLDAAILRAADELHESSRISDPTWARLARELDEQQLIELVILIGHYHLVSFALNTLGVEREEGVVGFPDH